MIEVVNINLKYGDCYVLKDFSLTLAAGEQVVISGESGSGKSSLFRILLGFEKSFSGEVHMDRSEIAWVPQELNLPVDTLANAVEELYSLKTNKAQRPQTPEILSLLGQLGLKIDSLNKNLQELSGGERQRFFIALALLLHKPILLLDEPTSALDPASAQLLIEVLRSHPVTLLAISHDSHFAASFDRTIHFKKTEL